MILILCAMVLCVAVMSDPYTWYADSSHAIRRAPWWQTFLAACNVAAPVGYVLLLRERRYEAAAGILLAGTLIDITANMVYVSRDGIHRFSSAFGDREFLTLYLGTVAVRVAMVAGALLLRAVSRPPREGWQAASAPSANPPAASGA